eukprot:CAMPEP_0202940374 /NCGR_PEP_ID=MMETSP1395-20130829/494_1 /ASSEMBLY_ACC=CAM_ASM_000871 /TAXON_ID=5961 /ORGANISM="Blepharisma japonicum, Strain Stock R1072" /LENGTH=573 /DNA_ID=CAMNT_0049634827 /DNA_START=480 /DNA_END=2201 /DNA_ORIENTATION=+
MPAKKVSKLIKEEEDIPRTEEEKEENPINPAQNTLIHPKISKTFRSNKVAIPSKLQRQIIQNANSYENIANIRQDKVKYDDDEPLPAKPAEEKKESSEETKTPSESTAAPQATNRLNISMKFAMNYLQLKSTDMQEVPCCLSLEGLETEEEESKHQARSGIDVICVIDVSGSMQGDKLELAKKTLEFMVTQLGPYDRASIVTFSDDAYRLCPLTCMNDVGKEKLNQIIKRINIIGGTEIIKGLRCGLRILAERKQFNSVSSIVLLSDGIDNNQDTAMERLRYAIREYDPKVAAQYSIHTFGYGSDHDANLMNTMAEVKNGGFYFVEKEDSIPEAFSNCLGELMSVVADQIQVQLQTQVCDIPFALRKVYSETGDSSFRMPPVLSGTKKEAIFLLNFPPCSIRVPENHQILPIKASITYRVPHTGEEVKEQSFLIINVFNEDHLIDEIELDEDVMVNFYRVKGAEILKEAGDFGDQGKMQEARDCLARGAQELRNSVVAGNELIQVLIADIENSVNRFADRQVWEHGGAAELKSKAKGHWSKRGPSNAIYQNKCQKAISKKSKAYFVGEDMEEA